MASNDPLTQFLDRLFGQQSGYGAQSPGAPTQLPGAMAGGGARHAQRSAPMQTGRSVAADIPMPSSRPGFDAPLPPSRPAGLLGGAPGAPNPIMQPAPQPGMPPNDPSAFLRSQGIPGQPGATPPMPPQMPSTMMGQPTPSPFQPPVPQPGAGASANVQQMLGNQQPGLPMMAQSPAMGGVHPNGPASPQDANLRAFLQKYLYGQG